MIQTLFGQILKEAPGAELNRDSNGPIPMELLEQAIELNSLNFKTAVQYLARSLKTFDLLNKKKTHNMLEINHAIYSVQRYKSMFFLLLAVKEAFNEFLEDSAEVVDNFNLSNLMKQTGKSASTKKIKYKGGGRRSRTSKRRPTQKKFSMVQYILLLFGLLSQVSGQDARNPVELELTTAPENLVNVKQAYSTVLVGRPYPTKGGQEVFTPTNQPGQIADYSLKKTTGPNDVAVPSTTFNIVPSVGNALTNWALSVLTPATDAEKLSKAVLNSVMLKEFNDISTRTSEQVTAMCGKLIQEIQLNNILDSKTISNLGKKQIIPGTSTTSYLGVTTTTPATEKHTYFNTKDLMTYLIKLCSVPDLLLEVNENEDGTYQFVLTRFGIPESEKLFANLTIAAGEHLSNLIADAEQAYGKDMAKKGIAAIDTEFSLITKDSIRRTFLLNLREKISLYGMLIDTTVADQQALAEIFAKHKKGSSARSDITTPEGLQNFLDSLQSKNKAILAKLEGTLKSHTYTTATPYTDRELKDTETLVDVQIQRLKQMELLTAGNFEQQAALLQARQTQQAIARNASMSDTMYNQTVNTDALSAYMNTFFSYAQGITAPIHANVGDLLTRGGQDVERLLNGAGHLLGGGVSSILTGLTSGLFGSWGWLAGLTFFSAVPIMLTAFVAWQVGGVHLVFRMIGGSVKITYAVVSYLPRKLGGRMISFFSRNRRDGTVVSLGTITVPMPAEESRRQMPMIEQGSRIVELPPSPAPAPAPEEEPDRLSEMERKLLIRRSAREAREAAKADEIALKEATARYTADQISAKLRLRNTPVDATTVGGRRYKKRTYKRKHNKRNRRSRRK